jgi:hypothetical protein
MEEKEIEVTETVEEDGSAEIEVVTDSSIGDIGSEDEAKDDPESKEEELDSYSKNVRQRISQITQKYRDEESARKSAVDYAEAVKKQNDELKQRLESLDQSYVGEFDTRIKSQVDSAKQAYQKAYDEGDADGMFEAQKNISRLAIDEAQLDQARKRQERDSAAREEARNAPAPQQQQQQQAQQPAPPDPKAEDWASKNNWFGTDQPMTYAAFGLHRQLIEEEGFDPTSDEYYTELDKRIRTEFPQKFKGTKRGDSGPRVASAESSASKASSGKGRRTVKLTPSQIAIAKRLNVPLEEYAKYVKE